MSAKLEQEVKFHIRDLTALEKRLEALGASLKQARTFERNLRFDTPNRELSSSFQVLRLRQDEICRLTYKGPSDSDREVSARRELEVEVSDPETARGILEALGYEVVVVYEKYRAACMLDEVEISLDEMPFGSFSEVEGPDIESIRRTAEKLGLNWEARSKLSYLAIFNGLKEKLDLKMRDLTFANFIDIQISEDDLDLTSADQK